MAAIHVAFFAGSDTWNANSRDGGGYAVDNTHHSQHQTQAVSQHRQSTDPHIKRNGMRGDNELDTEDG